jgi:ATP-dependent helicase/nuclease subunit A
MGEDRTAYPPPKPGELDAARRGTLLHLLFERLPGVVADRRREAALRWLEHSAGVTDVALRTSYADDALAIIANPTFAELFGSESLAEAPIAAVLEDGRVIAGTVDRLLVGADVVRVIDFKTGSRVPESVADIPAAHRAQMQAYAEALAVIFPDRRVEAALLYTSGPKIIAVTG